VAIANSILWSNEDRNGNTDAASQVNAGAGVTSINYSCIQGLTGALGGTGNIATDPLFVNALGIDALLGSTDDNLSLAFGSPCIDSGDNTRVPADASDLDADGDTLELLPTDLAGGSRFFNDPSTIDSGNGSPPIIDMGAFEAGDCNTNGVADSVEIAEGQSADCDHNGMPDECDWANGTVNDCNGNSIPDACEDDCNCNSVPDAVDIASGHSSDCTNNGIPDECEPDCNANGSPDSCDIAFGLNADCNNNEVPDVCDIATHTNGDCNLNGTPDICDLRDAVSGDCNGNGVLDDCEDNDCNDNGKLDACDLETGTSSDCNHNNVPDECDIARSNASASNSCGEAELACPGRGYLGTTLSMDRNGCSQCQCNDSVGDVWFRYIPAYSGIATIDLCSSLDDTVLSIHTDCTTDTQSEIQCNDDACGLQSSITLIVQADRAYFIRVSGTPVAPDIDFLLNIQGPPCRHLDCNGNGTPDDCDIATGNSLDLFPPLGDGIPDDCQGDCNGNGIPDFDDIVSGQTEDCNANNIPDECDIVSGDARDCDNNSVPDVCDVALHILTSGDINAGFVSPLVSRGYSVSRVSVSQIPNDLSVFDVLILGSDGVPQNSDSVARIDAFVGRGGGLILLHDLPNQSNYHGRSSPILHAGVESVRAGTVIVDEGNDLSDGLSGASTLTGPSASIVLKDGARTAVAWQSDGSPMAISYAFGQGRVVYFNDAWASLHQRTWSGDSAYGRTLLVNAVEFVGYSSSDCDANGIPDQCDIASDLTLDLLPLGGDGIPDQCQNDCNDNAVPDILDLQRRTSDDCDSNAIPDECDVSDGVASDCNHNLIPDQCDVSPRVLIAGAVSPGFVAGIEQQGFVVVAVEAERFAFIDVNLFDVIVMAVNERLEPYFCFDKVDNFVAQGGGLVLFQSRPWFASALCDASPASSATGLIEREGVVMADPTNRLAHGLLRRAPLKSTTTYPALKPGSHVIFRWSQDGAPMAVTYRYGLGKVVYFNATSAVIQDWDAANAFGTTLMGHALRSVLDVDPDCNQNSIPDECDINSGDSRDSLPVEGDGIPDDCQFDCNHNGLVDAAESASGEEDCNANGVPDECEPDCNKNGVMDICDLLLGVTPDCNQNLIPDSCDLAARTEMDCQNNGILDRCEIRDGSALDDNSNGVPDACDDCIVGDECDDGLVCTQDRCSEGTCVNTDVLYGDINGDDAVDVMDLSCELSAFSGTLDAASSSCNDADIAPCPTGDRVVNVFDIFAVLGAFSGSIQCDCSVPIESRDYGRSYSGPRRRRNLDEASAAVRLVNGESVVNQLHEVSIDVFIDGAQNLGMYEVDMRVPTAYASHVTLVGAIIDTNRRDFVFAGADAFTAVDNSNGRVVGGSKLDAADCARKAYLATFRYRLSSELPTTIPEQLIVRYAVRLIDSNGNTILARGLSGTRRMLRSRSAAGP